MKVGMQFSATCLSTSPSWCVRSNVNVRNCVPGPSKTGKVMDLYILTITFFGGRSNDSIVSSSKQSGCMIAANSKFAVYLDVTLYQYGGIIPTFRRILPEAVRSFGTSGHLPDCTVSH